MPRLNGLVYRIQTLYNGGFLFEAVNETDPELELKMFCSKLTACGANITSVVRIFPDSRSTPRIAVMDSEYKKLVQNFLAQKAEGKDIMGEDASLEAKLRKLLSDNEENLADNPQGYDRGYAEGIHDGIVDAMNAAGISHDEPYYN